MPHQIDALRLKVERAEEHVKYFEDLVLGRRGPIHTPQVFGLHYDDERKTTHFDATIEAPPPEWSIVIGEIIHQARSALDHLVCALALRPLRKNDPSVCKDKKIGLSFPIRKHPDDFRSDWRVSQGIFKGILGANELTAIETAQPYQRNPTDPTSDPLYVLSELDVIDKHRTILVLNKRLHIGKNVPTGFTAEVKPLIAGAEHLLLSWPESVPPGEVDMNDFTTQIVFAEPGLCENVRVLAMVRAMITTTEQVIDDFAGFF